MSKTKQKKDVAPLEVPIEVKAEALANLFRSKKAVDAEIKPIKEEIMAYVELHKKELFGDKKSCKIGGLEIAIRPDHSYVLGEDFNLVKFYKLFPRAVEITLSHTNMTNVDAKKYGIEHTVAEKVTVALQKEKAP